MVKNLNRYSCYFLDIDAFLAKFKDTDQSSDLTSALLDDFSKNGINVNDLYEHIGDQVPVDLLIKQNTLLVKELQEYQDKRYAVDDHVLSRGEQMVGKLKNKTVFYS